MVHYGVHVNIKGLTVRGFHLNYDVLLSLKIISSSHEPKAQVELL